MNRHIPYGHHSINSADIAAVVNVLRSKYITQGCRIQEFETDLCRYTGARYAVAVSSGTAALHIACLTAGVKSGDEVMTSPITFVASANCVLYCGAQPVFVDVQEDTVNIDPRQIRKKLHKKTKAIIPVHFAGHPCDLEEIREIARKNNLTVIEDAAHALGAEYKGSKVGSCKYSDMTIFSFHPVKAITTGEGGAVLTNNKKFYEKLLMLRNHGITKESSKLKIKNSRLIGTWYYEMQALGFNYRITDFQSALGSSQLKKLDTFIRIRRRIARVYDKELGKIPTITLPRERSYVKSARHIYYIRLNNPALRKNVFHRLQYFGIYPQVHYLPVYQHPYYQKILGNSCGNCPEAEKYYRGAITIPLYPDLRQKEIGYLIDVLKELLN